MTAIRRFAATFCLILGALLVAPAVLTAQGTITDGDVSWTYSTGDGGGDFVVGGMDHLFETWWFYRVQGETSETAFPAPFSESYVGNVATIEWVQLGETGNLFATLVVTLTDDGNGAATVTYDLTARHVIPQAAEDGGQGSFNFDLFHYTDFDLSDSSSDDSATLVNANTEMEVSDATATAQYEGVGASAYQVTAFATLRTALNDGAVTNLSNTGLPFGPGDFTGGYQWPISLPIQGQTTITAVHHIQTAPELTILEVPTLSPAGIGSLLLLLATAAVYHLRRRNAV